MAIDGPIPKKPHGLLGRKRTEAERAAISAGRTGRTLSEAERAHLVRLAQLNRGRKRSPEVVERRRQFKHSAETKARIAATVSRALKGIATRGTGWRHSDATKAKIAASHRGLTHSDATKAKLSAARLGRPLHTPEWRAAMSQRFRGRPAPYPNRRVYYNGVAFRSSWEARVATALDTLGIAWQYESRRFDLGTQTYAPDFFLPEQNAYWEIKGYYGPKSQKTIALFRQQYPEIPLVLLTERGLAMVERAAHQSAARPL